MKKEPLSISEKGFSLVEAVLSTSIFALLVTALIGAVVYGQESTMLSGSRVRATLLLEEGLEVTRNIRDENFTNLTNGPHGLAVSGGTWVFSGTNDITDIFTRTVTISSLDAKRKEISATVTWQQNPQRTGAVSAVTRFTRWLASGVGNWVTPVKESSINFAGAQGGRKVQLEGDYAYVVRNDGSPDFLIINISNPSIPVISGTLSLPGTPTNIAVSANYAYVTSAHDTQELQIIDISNPASPAVIGTYNAPGTANANGVFINSTTLYFVRSSGANDEFFILDVTVPASPTLIGSLELGGTANELVIIGNYAYIASSQNSQELQVVNITVPSAPVLSGSLNLAGTLDANTISGFSSTVIVGQGNTLFTIDVTVPSSPRVLGSLSMGGTVNDISLGNGNTYAFLATSKDNEEFQIADITVLSTPVLLGSFNITGTGALLGIAYDGIRDRAIGVGTPDAEEFFIFAPQ